MIHGSLTQTPETLSLLRSHRGIAAGVDWVLAQDLEALAEGRYPIVGEEEVVGLVMEYETVPAECSQFETHRRYIDLQLILSGSEIIEVHPAAGLLPDGDYNPETDLQLYAPVSHPAAPLLMTPGMFAVFFPEDAHRPQIATAAHSRVRKIVLKVTAER